MLGFDYEVVVIQILNDEVLLFIHHEKDLLHRRITMSESELC